MQASSSSPSGLPDQFFPPAQEGRRSALLLALLAHALLLLGLTLATRWNPAPTTLSVQAELWSALPQQMGAPNTPAPAVSAPPPQAQPEPRPAPQSESEPKPKPASKAQVAPELQAAQIALEKEKKKRLAEQAEREKLEREKEKRAAEEKRKQEQEEKERADKARAEKAKAEKAKAEKEKSAQEAKQALEREAQRRENLRRLQNLAGSSSGTNNSGSAARDSGHDDEYKGRIMARIKPKIVFPQTLASNPRAEVLVRLSPSGTILSRRLVTSSGNKAWDEAVLKAIDKTEAIPRDTDGRVPDEIILGFRPQD